MQSVSMFGSLMGQNIIYPLLSDCQVVKSSLPQTLKITRFFYFSLILMYHFRGHHFCSACIHAYCILMLAVTD